MADLKTGTTVGGRLVWTQGNFPLFPQGDSVLYKNFKVYSEYDKPQAIDNDFVSKAQGGVYAAKVGFTSLGITGSDGSTGRGLSLYDGATDGEPNYGIHFSKTATAAIGGLHPYDKTTPMWATYFKHSAAYPWNFKVNNAVVAYISPLGHIVGNNLIPMQAPTQPEHATRKDYVDAAISNVTTNANSRVLRAGDTMTGNLTVPAVVLNVEAANPNHAARLSQVVVKATVIDYGTF